jgi:deoxyribodipyrimidine photo-lyase
LPAALLSPVPQSRIRALNARPLNPRGDFVLYWMIAARRTRWNFALQRAVTLCRELRAPLLILEALDTDYPWANDRIHRFVLEGMAANAAACRRSRAVYYPFVERKREAGVGLIAALSRHACAVVTDHFPAFLIPGVTRAAACQSAVRLEAVDSNGLIPLSAHGRAFTTARSFRAFLQRELRSHLREFPDEHPLRALPRGRRATVPLAVTRRWRAAGDLLDRRSALGALPIDHTVPPVATRGGEAAARRRLAAFIEHDLRHYGRDHHHPDANGTSRLSPYLHFGHIGPHEVFSAVMTSERWTTRRLSPRGGGAREGWWGVSDSANIFLDQLVVWRELAFNACEWNPRYREYDSLPLWACETLEAHHSDPRRQYPFETLESAATHDVIWNATQRQLIAEGWFHGYLRMLWGKKILEWAPDPPAALAWMETLMNRYSLDGRDPVSYASFAWVLGRYDRPWPARPIFGTVRYMSSESAKRKLRMSDFLKKYGG